MRILHSSPRQGHVSCRHLGKMKSKTPNGCSATTYPNITLRYITLPYTKLRYITLCYIWLHYITLDYVALHYIALHCITSLHRITLH